MDVNVEDPGRDDVELDKVDVDRVEGTVPVVERRVALEVDEVVEEKLDRLDEVLEKPVVFEMVTEDKLALLGKEEVVDRVEVKLLDDVEFRADIEVVLVENIGKLVVVLFATRILPLVVLNTTVVVLPNVVDDVVCREAELVSIVVVEGRLVLEELEIVVVVMLLAVVELPVKLPYKPT